MITQWRSPRVLWLSAVLTFGVGDALTTATLFSTPGLMEANPIIREVWAQAGMLGLLAAKALVLLPALLSIRLFERAADSERLTEWLTSSRLTEELPEHLPWIPGYCCAVFAALGAYATAHNILLHL